MDFIFKVDPIRRSIKVPDAFTVLTMDHNIHKLVFVCPYYEDFAFDSASIVFMIDAPDGRQYSIPAEEYESFPNSPSPYVKFTLTLKSYITSVVGYMSFCITADIISSGNVIEKSWHSKNITISVGGHINNDDSEDIPEEDVPTINQRLNNLDSKVGRLQTTVNGMANGSPTPVATVAEMTDESAVYLYTGSETGYTAGNWYYYDGTAWTSGGTYGGAVTSTTFDKPGVPADDFAVGEALAGKADADDLTAVQTAVAGKADSSDVTALDTRVTAVEGDVSDLRGDLTTTNNNLNVTNAQFPSLTGAVIPPQFAVGSRYVQNGTDKWATNSTRLSIALGVYISLKAGDVVTKDATVYVFSGGYSTDGGSTFTSISNGYGPYTAPADGLYFFNLVKANSGTWTDAEALEGWKHIKFKRAGSVIDVLTASVNSAVSATNDVKTAIGYEYTQIPPTSYYTLEYTGKGLNYLGQVVDDTNQDTSDYIELTDDFYDMCRVVQNKQVWSLGKLCYYTANKTFIGDVALGAEYDFSIYNGETVVWIGVDKTLFENAKYIRYCGDNRRGFKYWLVYKGGKASVLDDYAHLRFGGKKIVNFGDSIFGNTRPPKDISSYIATLTGATVYNCGFGGCEMSTHSNANYTPFSMCSLADAIASVKVGIENPWSSQETAAAVSGMPAYFADTVDLLKTIDWSAVDIITIAYGSNDFNNGSPLDNGGNSDKSYFADALRYSIETILTAYPQIKIFICSIAYRAWLNSSYEFVDDTDTHTVGGNTTATFNDKLQEVAEEYHLPYIDDYNIGMNKYNRLYYFPATDGAHPKPTGNYLIAQNIAKNLF